MKYTIDDYEQMIALKESNDLLPTTSLQELIVALNRNDFNESEDSVIKVHTSLIAPSYIRNPYMLAKSLEGRTSHTQVRAKVSGSYIVIRIGEDIVPGPFRKRVLRGLRNYQKFSIDKTKVPPTYRRRPSVFTRTLQSEIEDPIVFLATDAKFVWTIKQK